MTYTKQAPEWFAPGVEPPEDKKQEGWQEGDHPPADWWNWYKYGTYEAIVELQQKALETATFTAHTSTTANVHGSTAAATANTLMQRDASGRAKVADPAADQDIATKIYIDSFVNSNPAPAALPLAYGPQVINMLRAAPYNVTSITGQTRVNLLGRDGNCEDVSKWGPNGSTLALESTNKAYGNNSIKITSTGTYANLATALKIVPIDSSKYYIFIIEGKNGTASGVKAYVDGLATTAKFGTNNTDTTSFKISYVKLAPADLAGKTSVNLQAYITGTSGQYGYFDGARFCEISAADYAASHTDAQVAAKWPYVDDMKPLTNPYALAYGKNIVPPTPDTLHANAVVNGPYDITLNATASYSESTFEFNAMPSTSYTFSGYRTGRWVILELNSAGNTVATPYNEATNTTGTLITTFTTQATTAKIRVVATNVNAGTFNFKNWKFELGSAATAWEPRKDQMIVFPTHLRSNVDGSVADTLYRRGSDYFVNRRFKLMDLDGSLAWAFGADYTGYKRLVFPTSILSLFVNDSQTVTKYDGKILNIDKTSSYSTPDTTLLNSGQSGGFHITIADADSGWGESYTPTADEIKAFFYGYKMYAYDTGNSNNPYTGTGTKGWVRLPSTNGATNVLPTTPNPESSWQPYKLQYQLASAVQEQIVPEGEITLREGLSYVEVGNGMILRERADPVFYPTDGFYYINNSFVGGATKYRAAKMYIYRGNVLDTKWQGTNDPTKSAWGAHGKIPGYNFDPSAAYTVTYLALDQYAITSNVLAIQGEYDTNLKTSFDRAVRNQADIATRVSVLESQKAGKVQPQWIYPTLLNGWVAYDGTQASIDAGGYQTARYFKDEMGFVHLDGLIKGGALGTIMFYLPKGYRPKQSLTVVSVCNSGSTEALARIRVSSDGSVSMPLGSGVGFLSVVIPPFLADQ